MKKLTLDFEEPNDYIVIGISSQIPDYKLLFHVNKLLKMQFVRVDNFEIKQKNFSGSYSLYIHRDQNDHLDFFLLANKTSGKVLIPQYKQLDYFFIIDGDTDPSLIKELSSGLRKLTQILFTQVIELEGIKDYSVLAEAFEIHLDKVMS